MQVFYVTGGTLRQDAACYVERQADKDLLQGLLEGEFCYVLTSRQMGKSSLMVRTAGKLREQGGRVAVLDLTGIGQNLTAEQWYNGLLDRLGQQLDLEDELEAFWNAHGHLGPLHRLLKALREVILADKRADARNPSSKLVIFVDEIDTVRSLPFSTDEFFAAIRECYNRRAQEPEFNRVTFCLLGVAIPSDLIRDVRMTPFNIGQRIRLNDFTEAEAVPLARGLEIPKSEAGSPKSPDEIDPNLESRTRSSELLVERVLHWTGGHPYLTQRLCSAIAEEAQAAEPADVDRHCEALFLSTRAREQDDNLIFVRERMLRSDQDLASLLTLYSQVLKGKPVPDNETNPLVSVLRLSGITRGVNGQLQVRNRIYAQVFDQNWVRANLPEAELRRQRTAFRGGLVRASVVGAGVLLLLGFLALYQKPLQQAKTLADGSRLALVKMEYGKIHSYDPGRFRWRALRDLLPQPLKRFVPAGGVYIGESEDSLFLWTKHEALSPNSPANWRWVLSDEHGTIFDAGILRPRGSIFTSPTQPEKYHIDGWKISAFPRRGKSIGVRLYAGDLQTPFAEFKFPNPAPGPYPAWVASPLPQAKKVDDLEFRLTAFDTGGRPKAPLVLQKGSLSIGPSSARTESPSEPWTETIFDVVKGGNPTAGWYAASAEVSDATGNRWHFDPIPTAETETNEAVVLTLEGSVRVLRAGSLTWDRAYLNQVLKPGDQLHTEENSRAVIRLVDRTIARFNENSYAQFQPYGHDGLAFDGELWPGEPCKLRVEFSTAKNQLGPDEIWTAPNLPVPVAGSVTELQTNGQLQGANIEVIGMAGAGVPFAKGVPFTCVNPTVHVRLTAPAGNLRLMLVGAQNDVGQEIKVAEWSSTDKTYAWGLVIPAGSKTLTLSFTTYRSRTVEFMAAPTHSPQKPSRFKIKTPSAEAAIRG